MDILLANPRGFCAGVERAIHRRARPGNLRRADLRAARGGAQPFVVDGLRAKGAVFVEELDEVPDGATVIFSAHGVSQAVRTRPSAARPARLRRHLPAGDQGAPARFRACTKPGARSS
jgi:4-hydroxy-3-methylbut-2-enyl diphosphate reductase